MDKGNITYADIEKQYGPCILITDKTLVPRIKKLARRSGITPKNWAQDVLDLFIQEHRSGKMKEDPNKYYERNDADECILHDDCYVED